MRKLIHPTGKLAILQFMEINADFSQRVVIHTPEIDWQDSPMQGVRRRMLDRVGDEVARATSIVSYAPESAFSPHVHTGGEEFLVLEGVFQDEHGDFPVGSYVRNPPGSSHKPMSAPGCVIFVKLWQFDLQDRQSVNININHCDFAVDPDRDNVRMNVLFEDERETVRVEQWAADSKIKFSFPGGAEILVLDGSYRESGDTLGKLSWQRLPVGAVFNAVTSDAGAQVFIKTGHLLHVSDELERLS